MNLCGTNFIIDGKVRFILEDVNTGEKEISEWYHNVIPTVGRTAMARRLRNAGTKTNEGIITYGAVGTGTSTAIISNTKLDAEYARKPVSSMTNVDNVLTVRTYYTTTEANGTITEFGLFGEDASATLESGTLFERVLISKTKTSAKTLTVESVITIG